MSVFIPDTDGDILLKKNYEKNLKTNSFPNLRKEKIFSVSPELSKAHVRKLY
jgi:hypothetical protein